MDKLVERLRNVTGFIRFETGDRILAAGSLSEEAAGRIEALEHANAVLQAKYDQAKTDRDTAMVKHMQEYAELERQLAEEKALGDQAHAIILKIINGPQVECIPDNEIQADIAAYRKARGM